MFNMSFSTVASTCPAFVRRPLLSRADLGFGNSYTNVTVLDQNGDPIANQTVAVAVTGSAILSTASATTNTSGVATVTLTDTTDETVKVSAALSGSPVSATASVTFTASPIFTVGTTNDSNPTTYPACTVGSGTCTLRSAVAGANAYPGGGALIQFPNLSTPATFTVSQGQVELSQH